MATAVGIMDERSLRARTDVLVVVDPAAESLQWVPRDLWCPKLGDRVNRAFELGGFRGLAAALAEHDIECANGLILSRTATERLIAGLDVMMPIPRSIELRVPAVPGGEIMEASRTVIFEPPAARLRGDGIHDWLSGRYSPDPRESSDLARIRRQQLFLAVVLGEGTDLSAALERTEEFELSSDAALLELRGVHATWKMQTVGPLSPSRIDGMEVLVPERR